MIVFVSVLAFILDGIISIFIDLNSIFIPLLTIMSMIIIYPYFQRPYKYFRYCAILGFLYDIAYYNTVFYNFFIFILLAFLITFFYYIFSNTALTSSFLSITIVFAYRLINIVFSYLFKNTSFSFKLFFRNFYSSVFINVIFVIIFYYLTLKYSKKHNILRIK